MKGLGCEGAFLTIDELVRRVLIHKDLLVALELSSHERSLRLWPCVVASRIVHANHVHWHVFKVAVLVHERVELGVYVLLMVRTLVLV